MFALYQITLRLIACQERARSKATVDEVLEGEPHMCTGRSVAQDSRPYRTFKVDARADNDSRGRKRMHDDVDAERTNWSNLLLWSQIENAAYDVGWRMSPVEIVKLLSSAIPLILLHSHLKFSDGGLSGRSWVCLAGSPVFSNA